MSSSSLSLLLLIDYIHIKDSY